MFTARNTLLTRSMALGAVGSFVTRDSTTGNLMLNGQRYRFGGANTPFVGLIGSAPAAVAGETVLADGFHYASHAQIDATLAAAQAFNSNVITSWGAVQSVGTSSSVQPTLGVFNPAALEPTDYCLKRCNELGIKIIANFSGNYTYETEGSKFWYCTANGVTPDSQATQFFTNTTIINSLKAHISFCLNHINQYTGIAYKDDPAILAWGTGGEMSVYPNNPEWPYYAWTDAISTHIKVAGGAKQLVADGHCAIRSDAQDGVIDVNSLTLANVDMYQLHPYSHWTPPRYSHSEGQIAHSYGKAFFIGEFPWQGTEPDTTSATIWTATELMSQAKGSPYIDGIQMWELLASNVTFGGGYTLHWPTPDNSSGHGLAMEIARGRQMAANNLAMSTGIVAPSRLVSGTTTWSQYNSAAYRGGAFNTEGITSWIPKAGEVILAFGASQGVNTVANAPAGWVNALGANVGVSSASTTLAVFYHIVTPAEALAGTVSYVISNMFGTPANGDGSMIVVSGLDVNNPIDAFGTASGVASTTHVLPALSGASLSKDSMVISCVCSLNKNTYTVPVGTGEAGASNAYQGLWVGLYDDFTVEGTNVAAKNITAANSDVYAAITLALAAPVVIPSLYPPVKRPNYGSLLQL